MLYRRADIVEAQVQIHRPDDILDVFRQEAGIPVRSAEIFLRLAPHQDSFQLLLGQDQVFFSPPPKPTVAATAWRFKACRPLTRTATETVETAFKKMKLAPRGQCPWKADQQLQVRHISLRGEPSENQEGGGV